VGILKHNDIDSSVNVIDDGGERIQCIELTQEHGKPIIIISVYMPTSGDSVRTMEYQDTVDQMFKIYQKYQNTHYIVIGGDLNEDLYVHTVNRRKSYILDVFNECNLCFNTDRKTFVNSKGEDCSEIDYFLFDKRMHSNARKRTLDSMATNTSDHHPITITVQVTPKSISNTNTKNSELKKVKRIKWDKIDKTEYQNKINEKMTSDRKILMEGNLESSIESFMNILNQSVSELVPTKKSRKNKPKLKVWNEDIAKTLSEARQANRLWREAGKPKSGQLVQEQKDSKRNLRKTYRVEIAMRQTKLKEEIMTARTKDTKLFHRLVNAQRKNNMDIDELYVGNKLFCGQEEVLLGFKEHFQNLATEKCNPNFDEEYHNICKNEVKHIIEIAKQTDTYDVTVNELKDALSLVNKGKSSDYYGLTIEHILHSEEVVIEYLLYIYNQIFGNGETPDIIKIGLLTPVFKNKGNRTSCTFYRGITVLPVLNKIMEAILKLRIQPRVSSIQSPAQ